MTYYLDTRSAGSIACHVAQCLDFLDSKGGGARSHCKMQQLMIAFVWSAEVGDQLLLDAIS